jgi:hypothetical protein
MPYLDCNNEREKLFILFKEPPTNLNPFHVLIRNHKLTKVPFAHHNLDVNIFRYDADHFCDTDLQDWICLRLIHTGIENFDEELNKATESQGIIIIPCSRSRVTYLERVLIHGVHSCKICYNKVQNSPSPGYRTIPGCKMQVDLSKGRKQDARKVEHQKNTLRTQNQFWSLCLLPVKADKMSI